MSLNLRSSLHGRTVKALVEMECEDFTTNTVVRFSEQHEMRYLFANDIAFFSGRCGMQQVASEEFLTGRRPSPGYMERGLFVKKIVSIAMPHVVCPTKGE